MKRKLFLLGAMALVITGAIFWSCQKEELLNPEDGLMLKKGKVEAMETVNPFTWTDACGGQEIVFTLEGTSNGDQIRIWGLNTSTGEYEWLKVGTRSYTTKLPAGTYYFIYKLGNDWFPGNSSSQMEEGIEVIIEPCVSCIELFDYNATYSEGNIVANVTFTYQPDVDLEDATIIFTFAQGVVVEGLDNSWDQNGQTWQKTMDLTACEVYEWPVSLSARCNGKGQNEVNAWTDFKIGQWIYDAESEEDVFVEISKKGSLSNIQVKCTE